MVAGRSVPFKWQGRECHRGAEIFLPQSCESTLGCGLPKDLGSRLLMTKLRCHKVYLAGAPEGRDQ